MLRKAATVEDRTVHRKPKPIRHSSLANQEGKKTILEDTNMEFRIIHLIEG